MALPEHVPFTLLEPLRDFFKDEVRQMGAIQVMKTKELVDNPFQSRSAVRILGEVNAKRVHSTTSWMRSFQKRSLLLSPGPSEYA